MSVMIDISLEGMKKARFLGIGILGWEHVVDLWELDMGDYKLPAMLDPGTRRLTRNPVVLRTEWELVGPFYWRPRLNG